MAKSKSTARTKRRKIDSARVDRAVLAIASGQAVDGGLRDEIEKLLIAYSLSLAKAENESRGARRGRRGYLPRLAIEVRAAIVRLLHDRHGIKIAQAASAMTEDIPVEHRAKVEQAIERDYRKQKTAVTAPPFIAIADRIATRLNRKNRK